MDGVFVIIPAFNAGRHLCDAVRSALALPFGFRVIVVDDGSQPPVAQSDFDLDETQTSRVRLIAQANAGPSAARNRGIEAARQEGARFIVFLDADDRLLHGIADSLRLAEETHAAAVVSGRVDVRPDGRRHERPAPEEWSRRSLPAKSAVFKPIALFGTPGLVISSIVIDSSVRFDESLKHGEDREFLRRVSDIGAIFVSDAVAVEYRVHDNGSNLNSPLHFDRRVRDFATIVSRYADGESDIYFRESALWLANAISKCSVPASAWLVLTDVFRSRRWRMPLKARFRRAFRNLLN